MAFADPEGSPEERETKLRETFRLMSVRDLRGAEFLRLLRLAHTEGLLAELMQAAALPDSPAGFLPREHSLSQAEPKEGQKGQPIRPLTRGSGELAKRIRMALSEIVVSTCFSVMTITPSPKVSGSDFSQ